MNKAAGLSFADEFLGVHVGQRCDPERRLSDQLGEHASGPEGDERTKDRILDETCQKLGTSANHGLHDHGWSDAGNGGTDRIFIRKVERDSAYFRLVRPGGRGLHDHWKVNRSGGGDSLVDRRR